MSMKSKEQRKRYLLYGLLLLLCGLYWCFDSAWSYSSYERNLNALLFMVPGSLLDTFCLNVSPYQVGARLGVVLLLLLSGTLLIELSRSKQQIGKALLESEERYQYLLEHANVGTCITINRSLTMANPKLLEICGYSEHELETLVVDDLIHPDDLEGTIGWYEKAIKGENPPPESPFRIISRDKSIKWVQISATLIMWRGEPALFNVIHDITSQQVREQKLQQAKKMEAIGLLAGGVAHDLNNILSGIVSYPELILQRLAADSPLRSHVQTMHEAGLRAAAVVADLLTVARGGVSKRHVLDLNMLANEFLGTPECGLLRGRHPKISIITSFYGGVVPVLCSRSHIQKSIMNLMFNACEAIEEGSGTVCLGTDCRTLSEDEAQRLGLEAGAYAVLSVSDTGPGISAEQKEHLFEPFYTRKKMGRSGTGLGLTVVWNTVLDHKGAIDVKSSSPGAIFDLYLPLSKAISKLDDNSPVTPDILTECAGSGQRILIVDDELQQREIGRQFLELLNYRPLVAASGEEAVAMLRDTEVDLVLLDMIMDSGLNGCETYEQIVVMHPGQKALIVSGYTAHEEIAQALERGVGAILKKPYTLKQLAHVVQRELERV